MARRTRTLEILTAAGLVPQQLAVEQARGARDARVAQALASLVPATINAGAGALGKLGDYQAEQDLLALKRDDLAAKSTADAATAAAQMARADAMKVKAEADKVKAGADASEATRKASEALAKEKRQGAMDAIEGGAGSAAALLPTGGDRRVVATFRPGESPLDEIERVQADSGMGLDQLAGMVDKQGLATRRAAADLKLAERKASAPLGPKPKSPEEIARQANKDALVEEQLKQLRDKPKEAAAAIDRAAAPTPLPAEMAKERALKLQGLDTIPKLRELKKVVGTGPIEGRAKDALGYIIENPERKRLQLLSTIVQRTAGKILEGGKLAEGDAKTYQKFLNDPTNMDDEEFNQVVDDVEQFLKDDLAIFDQEMRNANRQVGPRTPAPTSPAPAPSADVPMSDEALAARRAAIAERLKQLRGGQ